ncbi:MAG: TonB-dependent receptor [Sphingobacteriales bacterium]|nr:TonB-dependent receptor [Sphingobacteriales bacterium]
MRKKLNFLFSFLLVAAALSAQDYITGVVKDQKGVPVESASVFVKGYNLFAIANNRGEFKLTIPKAFPFVIYVTSIGFEGREIQISSPADSALSIQLSDNGLMTAVVITSRRRFETAQNVPIPISVIGGKQVENSGAFNVNRLKELIPTVQLYSSNPRNTTLNVRGLGSTFGLTNDGIDPGVGFYVDGVYYARPAATALDFIDIAQVEVLRGPQGTLFGKNTTAGAFNITTRAPRFKPAASFELSYGNYGYIQAKASVTGPLHKKLAGRISFSGTRRNGLIYNVATQQHVNDLNNIGARGQLLFTPTDKLKITLIGDFADQRPNGYAQVLAGVVQTKRAGYRQFDSIIASLNYTLPSRNAFDRVIDHNTGWRSGNQLGGVSINAEAKIGGGTLTSTTAWRYWNWDPSNDRDFTGLPVLTLSQATSKHQQWTQELRYAGNLSSAVSAVFGVFLIGQDLKTDPYHTEESGSAQWRFSQNSTSSKWSTPGLFDGYGIHTTSRLETFGAAVFGQADWAITEELHFLPGIRFNYDKKKVDFDRKTYGGLQTNDPSLIALKKIVYTDQAFTADVNENNFSGQVTLAYKPTKNFNSFATYSVSYKPVGINLGGLPTAGGNVLLELAKVRPEDVRHAELGFKSNPSSQSVLNLTLFKTEIKDYQTQVQTAEVGVNRGYLANAEKVRVWGVELDGSFSITKKLSVYSNAAYTDGKYISFKNAPLPLEETGATQSFKDVSKGLLPGISKWSGSVGGELKSADKIFFNHAGTYFLATDLFFRSTFSSSSSPSAYLNVKGYTLLNLRAGFRASEGLSAFVWARNLLDKDYFEQLLPAAGNAGHYAGVLGDPRTFGITLRYTVQ